MKSLVNNIRKMAFVAAAGLVAAACSDYSPEEYDGNLTKEEYKTIVEYTKNFEDRYGKMDPEQDWGFSEFAVEESEGTRSVRETRLGWVDANKNQWFDTNTGKSSDGKTIPGLPSDVDGRYITSNTSGEDVRMHDSYTTLNWNNQVPAGDVTDEEILYVSKWFREHPNPGTKEVKLNEFFIQEVSWDEDRVSYPDGAANDKVYWYDQNNALQSRSVAARMDQLFCLQNYKTDMNDWQSATHLYNMNNGNTNIANAGKSYADLPADKTTCGTLFPKRSMSRFKCQDGDYVTSFAAHQTTDDNWTNRYVFVHLEFTGPASGKKYSGDYIAFDFGFNGKNAGAYDGKGNAVERKPDGYYSNWILKISPAEKTQAPEPSYDVRRVMCEDLGNTDDFDFNDLVFDVYFTKQTNSKYTAHITVKAVGGTLPIYLDYDMSRELHAAMGGDVKQPINVGAQGGLETTNYYETTIENMESPQADDIPIIVVREGGNQSAKISMLPKSTNRETAPQKICVPTTVKWMKERMQIEQGYPGFGKWVQDKNDGNAFWNGTVYSDYIY